MIYSNNPLNSNSEQDPSVRYRNFPGEYVDRALELSSARAVQKNSIDVAKIGLTEVVVQSLQPIETPTVSSVSNITIEQQDSTPVIETSGFDRERQIREANALTEQAFREAA